MTRVEMRLQQVKRTSLSAQRACWWLMVLGSLIAVVTAWVRLTLPETFTCDVDGLRAPCGELPRQATTVAFVALIGGLSLALTALYRLARLFGNYSRGEIFTRGSVREIRMIGYVVAAAAVLQLALFIWTASLRAAGEAPWPLELRFDPPLVQALIAGLITLLSWVMDVGAELREENELTV